MKPWSSQAAAVAGRPAWAAIRVGTKVCTFRYTRVNIHSSPKNRWWGRSRWAPSHLGVDLLDGPYHLLPESVYVTCFAELVHQRHKGMPYTQLCVTIWAFQCLAACLPCQEPCDPGKYLLSLLKAGD